MTPQEHYAEAERLLALGVRTVDKISRIAGQRLRNSPIDNAEALTRQMDELGKKAAGIWAQAQVHATLANLAYRTALEVNPEDGPF